MPIFMYKNKKYMSFTYLANNQTTFLIFYYVSHRHVVPYVDHVNKSSTDISTVKDFLRKILPKHGLH